MQLAAYFEQVPSLIKSVPEPVDALDSLLASPSMWDLDSMLPDHLENSSDRSADRSASGPAGARAQSTFASGERAAFAALNDKQLARRQYVNAGGDRKLAMSREVQKRFRQRQKVSKMSEALASTHKTREMLAGSALLRANCSGQKSKQRGRA